MEDKNNSELLAQRLREARGNDTQSATAEKVFTQQSDISKFESGKSQPSIETLIAYSKAYGVSTDWLLGLSDVKRSGELDDEKITYEQVIRCIEILYRYGMAEETNLGSQANPNYDPCTITFTDKLLQYLLDRMSKVAEAGSDIVEAWNKVSLQKFNYPIAESEFMDTAMAEYDVIGNSEPTNDDQWLNVCINAYMDMENTIETIKAHEEQCRNKKA